jgi:membrane fusion protein, heavy metal efflux system
MDTKRNLTLDRKSKILGAACTGLLIALTATGCSKSAAVETKPAEVPPPPNTADVVTVTAEQLRQFRMETPFERKVSVVREATGKVAFNEDNATPVFSPYTGRIMRLLVKPGDAVRKGEPLVEIDTPDIVAAESDLLTGKAALAKAGATLRQAERNRDRLKRLVAGEAAPVKDLEQATTDAQNAGNDVRAAEAATDAALQRLTVFGKSPEEIQKIVTTRQVDRIAKIFSPISGTVVARKAGPGQYIRPDASDPIFTIADLSSMWMLADVYESDVAAVRLNEPVQVSVIAFPNERFNARVTYIAPSVDPITRRVPVRCLISNPGQRLKPEMFASFRIANSNANVLTVPQKAVVRDNERKVVWVLRDGKELVRRSVETGLEQDGWVEIRTGLQPGDRVISDGAVFVSNVRNS